ncbi:MAG TPA: hypothetical protein VH138_17725 [Vicinamibacterales bacterium]|nr:hypothetical protein [Vicinamibacterales bacterium]
MDNKRHFIFRGHAVAFGGQLIRPKPIVLEAPCSSALTVSGGRSIGRIPPTRFDEFFSVDSASTFAEGLFEDPKQFLDSTNHLVEEDTLTAVTHVNAEVNGLVIGREPRLTIKRVRADLRGRSPLGSGQPAIRVGDLADVFIDGIEIGGRRLIVELDTAPFQRFDTLAKLLVAADDPAFVEESGECLFLRTPRDGGPPPPPAGRLIQTCGAIYGTIVKSIRWDGPAFPAARIVDNSVVLEPDFGRVFFGELLISEYSRRLNMVRFALGSDSGGSASASDVCTNGMLSP